MKIAIQVMAPGVSCTVQDLGRTGHQRFGVPPSGAMDPFALQVGNMLVGNEPGAAAIEMAMRGPTLVVRAEALLCLCGADLGALLDGEPIPPWQAFAARPGQELRFAGPARGVWAYLCIAGGIDVPVVMGSRSTYARAGFGGLEGRALRPGDELHAAPGAAPVGILRSLQPDAVPRPSDPAELRVVPGPQADLFLPGALAALLSGEFVVTTRADRMGYCLEGPALLHATGTLPPSEGTSLGSIQVPPDGRPIVLMPDRQTIGGYLKIATVISVDVPRLAQLLPGARLLFRAVGVEEAHEALRELRRALSAIARECGLQDGASA